MRHATDTLVKPLELRQRRPGPWLRRALIFATVVVLVDALVGESGLVQTIRARRDYAQARGSLSTLRYENAGLRERARRLDGDPGAIEAVAREEHGLIRPGEVLFVLRPAR
ncbi:MAG TPA: septum formation initiator family protein [Vicinamibacterales bacterium]|nr:septum formation initiator family protein [Vicinamibacterales bacterium]